MQALRITGYAGQLDSGRRLPRFSGRECLLIVTKTRLPKSAAYCLWCEFRTSE